ncbi:phage protein, HK97 gp10 family [Sporobacter termitidis DSM 10068]|uniref:Phage protein, HK97 gp10 family n=1 Tax=Sporobacter termitidis DSM 10068 TaxID=1123282 RepID=A0A1M5ZM69_9FIRM|nr:HK97-gp10 family putative phage morphogenesis protein [Sporobacter termitidis]SHI25023.1 phage protein, HK97 gp10 family [Sporobacter termitidis DSM 10068]
MEIEIKGLDKLLKKLDRLGGDVEQGLNRAIVDLGEKIQAAAKEECTVDTGNLRSSITLASPAPNTVTIGTNVEYAPYVEYGTGGKGDPSVPHTTKEYWRYRGKGGQWFTSHGQEPQPFMRPAFARYKDKAGEIVKKSLEGQIKGAR